MSLADTNPPYSVTYSAEVVKTLREWGERAVQEGFKESYLDELRRIESRLRMDPREWGDPIHDLSSLALTAYIHCSQWLIVKYYVHATRPVVMVQSVNLSPYSPLWGEDGR